MAPLHHLINHLKRSEKIRRSGGAQSDAPLDIGATVGIAIGIAFVCSFALATFVYYYATRQSRKMHMRARRGNWAGSVEEGGVYGTKALSPRAGLGRVLSMFSSKGRRPAGEHHRPSHYLSDDDSKHRQLPGKELDDLRESAVELNRGVRRGDAALVQAQGNHSAGQFGNAHGRLDGNGPVPSPSNSERDVSSEGPSAPNSAEVNNLGAIVPSTLDATAAPAAWHRKRTGPPPPLTIEPPGMHAQSPMDPYSAYSTYATQSPYEYCSINVPNVPALPPQILSNNGFGIRFPYDEEDALHSASSTRSSHPLQYPPSPQTPVSIPSMSRSDSGAQESQPLAPPTPTYSLPRSQPSPQRAAIEATHFECLGPLPDHIPIPSPPHFRTQHQQQQDPFLTPRVRTPDDRSLVGQERSTVTSSASGETIQVFAQDPLLHETNPFRQQPSPVHPTFDRAHSVHAYSLQESDLSETRRESTDSLGSNFTVEEEARIQEQIVRNLDALDKERVMGERDIVHIPQISERRYSWE